MSADDHLNQAQFYHGSPNKFSGQVEPTDQGHYARRAYFTTDYDTAKAYARSAGGTKGYVYGVHPLGEYERDEYERGAFKSSHPLAVLSREEIPTERDLIPDAAKAKLKKALGG